MVNRLKIGNTSEWTLNRESILVKNISNLVDLDEKIFRILSQEYIRLSAREKVNTIINSQIGFFINGFPLSFSHAQGASLRSA